MTTGLSSNARQDAHELLAKYIINTRQSFTSSCKACDLDPKLMSVVELSEFVSCCDNCGTWRNYRRITKESDGTLYCSYCTDAEKMRF